MSKYLSPRHCCQPVATGLLTLVFSLATLGCASSNAPSRAEASADGSWSSSPGGSAYRTEDVRPSEDEVVRRLRREERAWRGTPYRWGGTSHEGVDCSGFVQAVFDRSFGITLPRTTSKQVRAGTDVTDAALRPGDLIFFRPSRAARHVGVYLGAGEFAHASTSQGVTISRLDDPYWQQAYWTARRVLPPPITSVRAHPPSALNVDAPRPSLRTKASEHRSGW